MSTLAEIKLAADAQPPERKQEEILFLATWLQAGGGRAGTIAQPVSGPRKSDLRRRNP